MFVPILYIYIYIHYVYLSTCMCIYIYIYECMKVWMYVCMYVCMFKNERVCHTISGLKCCIRRTPPTSFGSPKNMWGGYISCGQVKYFSEISCLTPPPNIPGLKGGGCHTIVEALQKNATEIKLCRWEHPDGKFDWTWGVRSLKPQCLPPFSRVNITGFRDTCLPFQRHPDQSGRSEPANALSYIQSTRNLNTNFAAMHDHACILHWV